MSVSRVFAAIGACVLMQAVGCDGGGPMDGGVVADAGRDAGDVDAGPPNPWRLEASFPVDVQEIAVAAHRGRIWVAGGFVLAAVVPTVRVLDATTGEWSEGPPLPAPRHHMSLVSHGDALYAFGGMQTLAFEPLDTAWVLRSGADAWEPIASLPEDRGAAAAGAVGDVIVLAGGNSRSGSLAETTLVYDVADDAWTIGAGIPTPREHLAAASVGAELWVLGGRWNSLSSNRVDVAMYDPATDAWRSGPDMPLARGGFGAALLDGSIYVVGGEESGAALTSVDRLDVATETWSDAPPTRVPHHGHGVVVLDGRVWAVAGGDAPGFAAMDVIESYAP